MCFINILEFNKISSRLPPDPRVKQLDITLKQSGTIKKKRWAYNELDDCQEKRSVVLIAYKT